MVLLLTLSFYLYEFQFQLIKNQKKIFFYKVLKINNLILIF